MADGTALDGASAVHIRRPEAVRGSNQDTFIERDTASSEAQIWTQMCRKQQSLKIFFLLERFSKNRVENWQVGSVLLSSQSVITQSASCPTFIWGLANFKFVIFPTFPTFNPAPLIASSAMQMEPLPQYVIRAGNLEKSVIPNSTK